MTSPISGDFGDAVLVLMKSPSYGELPLKALKNLILEPMDRGQLVIARGKNEEGIKHPIGLICVAKVSDDLHQRLQDTPDQVQLTGDDWTSGEHVWFAHADGPSDFIVNFMKQVRDEMFDGKDVWVRARGSDGDVVGAKLP